MNAETKSKWQELVAEARADFDMAGPMARLVYTCEIGQLDQHASLDLMAIMEQIEHLEFELCDARLTIDGLERAAREGQDERVRSLWDDNERMKFALRDIREQCDPGTFAHIAAREGLGE